MDAAQHVVAERPDYVDEFLWAADLLQDLPKSFPVHRFKGFGKVYEYHVKILMLLMTIFLYLSGRKVHVSSTITGMKATLALG